MASSGRCRKRVDTALHGKDRRNQNQHDIAGGPIDETGDHFTSPWARPCSAALRLLSASIKKFAATTTLSD